MRPAPSDSAAASPVSTGAPDGSGARSLASSSLSFAPGTEIPLFNRETSWLEFNRRVLAEAENRDVPILERLKFVAIAANNLDEFLQVRFGGVRELVVSGVTERSRDGLTPRQQLRAVRVKVRALLDAMHTCLAKSVFPGLSRRGIAIVELATLRRKQREALAAEFLETLAPVLTPFAVDPGHPFPFLANLDLNLVIQLESKGDEPHVAFLKIPPILPRFIPVPGTRRHYIAVETLIAEHAGVLFPGLRVTSVTPFRVIRHADLHIAEDEVQDLLATVENELRRRERKEVVWIAIGAQADDTVVEFLAQATGVARQDVFRSPGMLKLADLMQVYAASQKAELIDPPFNPRIPARLATKEDIFSIIRAGDVLLHRPYDSFAAVVELLQTAASDPDVLAIKQTLYRMDSRSPIVSALAKAALAGKHVTVLVELQARFDEKRNIEWARQLEDAGVQVVYGHIGLKTHCKICLVVRREGNELRRYLHTSTGNYNASTARIYTDVDLFTTDPGLAEDAAQLMNLLTGFSHSNVEDLFERGARDLKWRRAIVAPMDYHRWVLETIERETRNALAGRPARIAAKMNALVEVDVIRALYRASQAGVEIDLAVRGICCLVPGVKGVSERIRIVSVLDRFLEHPRVFVFHNAGAPEVWVSSGDWMPRNFFRRFEFTFPILDPKLAARIEREILPISLADNVKGWDLLPDGTYRRRVPVEPLIRSQERFIEIARAESVSLGMSTYDEVLAQPSTFRKKAKRSHKKDKEKGRV